MPAGARAVGAKCQVAKCGCPSTARDGGCRSHVCTHGCVCVCWGLCRPCCPPSVHPRFNCGEDKCDAAGTSCTGLCVGGCRKLWYAAGAQQGSAAGQSFPTSSSSSPGSRVRSHSLRCRRNCCCNPTGEPQPHRWAPAPQVDSSPTGELQPPARCTNVTGLCSRSVWG